MDVKINRNLKRVFLQKKKSNNNKIKIKRIRNELTAGK